MSDITINSSENQEDNQKTTPVTGSLSEPNDSSLSLSGEIFSTWLGREYVNGTFTDEDIQNVDDIEEIQKLLDDTSEDEPCSE